MKEPKLSSGTRGFYDGNNNFVPTGSMMGRSDKFPGDDASGADWPPLHVRKMKMVDYAYDNGGAYWGGGDPRIGWMYIAYDKKNTINLFTRAIDRRTAIINFLIAHPKAKFLNQS